MKKIIVIFIIISFALTGCWDSVETEELGVIRVLGIGIGKNNDIRVIIQETPHEKQQITNQGASSDGKSSFNSYAATGITVYDALQKVSASEHHKLNLSHTKVVILDESLLSSKGINPVIDFLQRNPKLRPSTWILISPLGQFDEIFNTNTDIGIDTGAILEETINNKKKNSILTINNIKDFVETFNRTGGEAYASGVSIRSKEFTEETTKNSPKFHVRDIAVFKADKMVGWLTGEKYRGFSWINGYVKGAIMNIPFENGVISLQIIKIKSKLQPQIDNQKMKINISVKVLSKIIESQSNYNFMNKDAIKKVEQIQNEKMKLQIIEALEASKKLDSDVFGIGSYFYMKYPKFWNEFKKQYGSQHPAVEIDINIDSSVKEIGNTRESS